MRRTPRRRSGKRHEARSRGGGRPLRAGRTPPTTESRSPPYAKAAVEHGAAGSEQLRNRLEHGGPYEQDGHEERDEEDPVPPPHVQLALPERDGEDETAPEPRAERDDLLPAVRADPRVQRNRGPEPRVDRGDDVHEAEDQESGDRRQQGGDGDPARDPDVSGRLVGHLDGSVHSATSLSF